MSKRARKALINYVAINDRLILARFKQHMFNVSIIAAYAPTEVATNETKSQFYLDLQDAFDSVPGGDMLYIMGDFNAEVGGEHDTWKNVIGNYALGQINDNGHRLLEFCRLNKLCIPSTFFNGPEHHRYMFVAPGERYTKMIDYIIVKQRFKSWVTKARAYRGPNAAIDSDHFLVKCTSRMRLRSTPKKKLQTKFNCAALRDPDKRVAITNALESKIGGTFDGLDPNPRDTAAEDLWQQFK